MYDRFYLGATIGAYSLDYKRTSLYKEDFIGADGNDYGGYDLGNDYWTSGGGVDLFGVLLNLLLFVSEVLYIRRLSIL